MVAARAVLLSGALGFSFYAALAAQGHSKSETEPNDSLRTANIVVLGDTISGTIAPNGERDMFVIQLDSGVGQRLRHLPEVVPPPGGGRVLTERPPPGRIEFDSV